MISEKLSAKPKQADAVHAAMQALGGYATFGALNQTALKVPGVEWKTKTPFATIRRIVQTDDRFFKLRPGLWALTAERDRIVAALNLSPTEPTAPVEAFDHGYYQGLLVELGNFKQYETFVPYQDKNRAFLERKLADITTLPKFHEFTYDRVLRRAVTVDVTWFNARGFPHAFYEVEHSTDIYNSLLKFVDLQDFRTRFCIVADKIRKREFEDRLAQAAFAPISKRVEFLDYDTLAEQHTKITDVAALPDIFS